MCDWTKSRSFVYFVRSWLKRWTSTNIGYLHWHQSQWWAWETGCCLWDGLLRRLLSVSPYLVFQWNYTGIQNSDLALLKQPCNWFSWGFIALAVFCSMWSAGFSSISRVSGLDYIQFVNVILCIFKSLNLLKLVKSEPWPNSKALALMQEIRVRFCSSHEPIILLFPIST